MMRFRCANCFDSSEEIVGRLGLRKLAKKTKNPHGGMNSKRRSESWSYPGAGKWQREQSAAGPLRGRTATSILLLSALKRACS
jgi:hypothetical protein